MPLSDVQLHEFMVLWNKAAGYDISSDEARLIAADLSTYTAFWCTEYQAIERLMQSGTVRRSLLLN